MPNDDELLGKPRVVKPTGPKPFAFERQVAPENYLEVKDYLGTENVLPYDAVVLNELAAQSQSAFGNLAKGIGRVGGKVVTEVLSLPGYIAGGAAAIGNQISGDYTANAWDNWWLQQTGSLDNFFKQNMPVYLPQAVSEGGIVEKLGSGSWWATTGADGIGFMVSMLAPGQALKAMGVGKALAGTRLAAGADLAADALAVAGEAVDTGNALSRASRILKPAFLRGGSVSTAAKIDSGLSVLTNTFVEAAAEGNNTYLTVRDKLLKNGKTEEEANRLAGEAAAQVFDTNLGILAISNTIMEKFVMRGFDYKPSLSKSLKSWNPVDGAAPAMLSGRSKVTKMLKSGIGGFINEGLWEEGMQTSAQQYFSKLAEEGGEEGALADVLGIAQKWFSNLTELEGTEDSREFYEGAVLGGILGAPMQMAGTSAAINQENQMLFGRPETNPSFAQRMMGKKPTKASPGLVALMANSMSAGTIDINKLAQTDENGNILFDENGNVAIDKNKINAAKQAVGENLAHMVELARLESNLQSNPTVQNQAQLEIIKNIKEDIMLRPYIQTEGGAELFESHVDAYVNKMRKDNSIPNEKEAALEKRRLVDKVKSLSRIREVIDNRHANTVAFLKKMGGTQEEKAVFSENLYSEKLKVASVTDMLRERIKEVEQKAIVLGAKENRTEVEEEELRTLKETEKALKEKEGELETRFKELNDRAYLENAYAKYLKQEEEVKEENEKAKQIATEKENPEYVDKLIAEAGYDQTEPVYMSVNGNKYKLERFPDGTKVLLRKNKDVLEYLSDDGPRPYTGTELTPEEKVQLFMRKEGLQIKPKSEIKRQEQKEKVDELGNSKELMLNSVEALIESNSLKMSEVSQLLSKYEELDKIEEEIELKKKTIKELQQGISDLRNTLIGSPKKLAEQKKAITKRSEAIKEIEKGITELSNFLEEKKKEFASVYGVREVLEDRLVRLKIAQTDLTGFKEKIRTFSQENKNQLNDAFIEFVSEISEQFVGQPLQNVDKLIEAYDKNLDTFIENLVRDGVATQELLEGFNGRTDQIEKAIFEFERNIEDMKVVVEKMDQENKKIKDRIDTIESKTRVTKKSLIEKEQLENKLTENLLRTEEYKNAIETMRSNVKELRKILDAVEANPLIAKKSIDELYKFVRRAYDFKAFVGRMEEMSKLLPQEQQDDQVAVVEAVMENKEPEFKRPAEWSALTGLDVEFDDKGKDKFEDGVRVFNQNPQAQNWFGFVEALMRRKMDMKGYRLVAVMKKNMTGEEELALGQSLAARPNPVNVKDDDVFVFLYKGEEAVRNRDTLVFAPMRSIDRLESNLSEEGVIKRFRAFKKSNAKEAAKYGKDEKAAAYAYVRDLYQQFKNNLESNGGRSEVGYSGIVGGIPNREYENGKPKRNKVQDAMPELFQRDKYPKVKIADRNVSFVGDVEYNISAGLPYLEYFGRPVVLEQMKLNDGQIETIVHLYASLYENKTAKVGEVSVFPEKGRQSLLTTLLNHGNDRTKNGHANTYRIFVAKGNVVFSEGKENPVEQKVSLEVLKRYVNNEELAERDKVSIQALKSFLANRNVFVNKSLLEKKVSIPYVANGKISLKKMSYEKFLFDEVFTTSLTTGDRKFVSPNLVIDSGKVKSTVQVRDKKEKVEKKREPDLEFVSEDFSISMSQEEFDQMFQNLDFDSLPAPMFSQEDEKAIEAIKENEKVVQKEEERMEGPIEVGEKTQKPKVVKKPSIGQAKFNVDSSEELYNVSDKVINEEEAKDILNNLISSEEVEKICD